MIYTKQEALRLDHRHCRHCGCICWWDEKKSAWCCEVHGYTAVL